MISFSQLRTGGRNISFLLSNPNSTTHVCSLRFLSSHFKHLQTYQQQQNVSIVSLAIAMKRKFILIIFWFYSEKFSTWNLGNNRKVQRTHNSFSSRISINEICATMFCPWSPFSLLFCLINFQYEIFSSKRALICFMF